MAVSKLSTIRDVRKSISIIHKDLRLAEGFYYTLTQIWSKLNRVKSVKKEYESIFHISYWSLDISFVLTLCKVFEPIGKVTLGRLVEQMKTLNIVGKQFVDSKKYKAFLAKSMRYEREIKRIHGKLSPLRNKFRAHNHPDRPTPGKTT